MNSEDLCRDWFKWDLHLHAPGTARNNKFENGLEEYCKLLIGKRFDVVGITDYFSIDAAFRVRDELRRQGSNIVVFPNMELRDSKIPNKQRLNYHVLFGPHLEREEINDALKRIDSGITDSGGKPIYLAERPASEYGGAHIPIEAMRTALGRDFKWSEDFVIGVASGSDGFRARGDRRNRSEISVQEQNRILRNSDFIFGNKDDQAYWIAPLGYDGKPRAVFQGCDAHSEEHLEEFYAERGVNWVRALPTMQGLAQVLVEPESRSKIDFRRPYYRRTGSWIESIRLTSNTESKTDKIFDQKIELSAGLNSIIGSRSSGKSILLSSVAYSVNSENAIVAQEAASPWRDRMELGPAANWSWESAEQEFDCQINWDNGDRSDFSGSMDSGNLVYVPQGYLNLLSESESLLQQLIEKSIPASGLELVRAASDLYRDAVASVRQAVANLDDAAMGLQVAEGRIAQKRARKDVEADFAEAEADLAVVEKLDPNDPLTQYMRFQDQVRIAEDYLDSPPVRDIDLVCKELRGNLRSLSLPESGDAFLDTLLFNWWISRSEEVVNEYARFYKNYSTWGQVAMSFTEDCLDSASSKASGLANDHLIDESLDSVDDLRERRDEFRKELRLIETLEADVNSGSEKVAQCCSHLELCRSGYISALKSIENSFNSLNLEFDEMKLRFVSGHTGVDDDFLAGIGKLSQPEAWLNFRDGHDSDLPIVERFDVSIIRAVLEGEVRLNKNVSRLEVATRLATSLPTLRVQVEYDGDLIGGFESTSMSAGKRALVGLKFHLFGTDEIWPLLLDQPEDDLDSRSLTDIIVPYLRSVRQDRQVIMVSHDANLVVASDSDRVIVANQRSDDFGNFGGVRFRYTSGRFESEANDLVPQRRDFGHSKSISAHVCELLDGGREAFNKRSARYGLPLVD